MHKYTETSRFCCLSRYALALSCLALFATLLSCHRQSKSPPTTAALVRAIQDGSAGETASLLDQGVPVNDTNGVSPLNLAIERSDAKVVKVLLEHGADPNLRESPGSRSPLENAISKKEVKVVQLLVNKGAQVEGNFDAGVTPLMRAVKANNIEIVRVLLKAGADPYVCDNLGNSAMTRAALGSIPGGGEKKIYEEMEKWANEHPSKRAKGVVLDK